MYIAISISYVGLSFSVRVFWICDSGALNRCHHSVSIILQYFTSAIVPYGYHISTIILPYGYYTSTILLPYDYHTSTILCNADIRAQWTHLWLWFWPALDSLALTCMALKVSSCLYRSHPGGVGQNGQTGKTTHGPRKRNVQWANSQIHTGQEKYAVGKYCLACSGSCTLYLLCAQSAQCAHVYMAFQNLWKYFANIPPPPPPPANTQESACFFWTGILTFIYTRISKD